MTMATNEPGIMYGYEIVPNVTTDGGTTYLATHPDLSGCMAHGDTPDLALQNLAEARQMYIASLERRGLPVPKPTVRTVQSVKWKSYASGSVVTGQPITRLPVLQPVP